MVVFDRLWSGRAVTEHKYVFLVCVCVYMYVSNHFNHCIKLFAPCGPLIGNKKILILIILILIWNFIWGYKSYLKIVWSSSLQNSGTRSLLTDIFLYLIRRLIKQEIIGFSKSSEFSWPLFFSIVKKKNNPTLKVNFIKIKQHKDIYSFTTKCLCNCIFIRTQNVVQCLKKKWKQINLKNMSYHMH
jgi:hypothetical protein